MREILFRGKCTDTGKWFKGQYIHLTKTTYCFKEDYDRNPDNDIHQIVFVKMTDWGLPNRHLRADVIPETVGQYTGLTDRNGKKIFEGDILKYKNKIGYVVYRNGCFSVQDIYSKNRPAIDIVFNEYPNEVEIIGNIHDNPELLKGE